VRPGREIAEVAELPVVASARRCRDARVVGRVVHEAERAEVAERLACALASVVALELLDRARAVQRAEQRARRRVGLLDLHVRALAGAQDVHVAVCARQELERALDARALHSDLRGLARPGTRQAEPRPLRHENFVTDSAGRTGSVFVIFTRPHLLPDVSRCTGP
jgi:hypothetical protein